MNPLRLRPLLAVALAAGLSTVALAQSDAQQSFSSLKTLAGSWEGTVTTVPPMPGSDNTIKVTLRVTSRGNALMHEMTGPGSPDDPITMLYLENGRLLLTHYCDAGNRPRMAGALSADRKSVAFDMVDIAGSTEHGHMHQAAFTIVGPDHHVEEWTFMMPGDVHVHARMDLHRVK